MKSKLLHDMRLSKPLLLSTRKAVMLCLLILFSGISVLAGTHKVHVKYSGAKHKHKKALNLNPTLSYSSPVTFSKGISITPLAPVSSGVGAPGYNAPNVIGQAGIIAAHGVAADASGNVYVGSANASVNSTLIEIPAGGGPLTQVGSGLNAAGAPSFGNDSPGALAVDAGGDIFVVDGETIKEIQGGNTITIGFTGNYSSPTEIALDPSGNIYVADESSQDGGGIKEFQALGGGAYSSTYVMIGSGFTNPDGVAVDGSGNVYVADYGNNAIKEVASGNGPITTLTSFTEPLSIAIDASGNLFVAGDAQFSAITEFAGGNYNTPVAYGSGFNNANYLSVDASGDVYLVDVGNDEVKEIPAGNGMPVILAPGFSGVDEMAADATGNLFIADPGNDAVREIPAGGSNYPTTLVPGFNFSIPIGVAVDAAENVYVGDAGVGLIYKIAPGATTPAAIGSGLSNVVSIAVDANGDIFACNNGHDLYEIVAGSNTTVVVNTNFGYLASVALDGAGNIYTYDRGTREVYKLPPGGAGTPIVIATGINQALYLTADGPGNVYIGFYGNGGANGIDKIAVGSGTISTVATTVGVPASLTIDGAGNLYCKDAAASNPNDPIIDEISPSGGYYLNNALPAGLSFNNTTGVISGTPTVLSPPTNYTVTAYGGGGSTMATINIQVTLPPLTITAINQDKVYGAANPTLTIGYSGFVPGDTPASLTTQPTISTTATTASPVGAYPITVGGAVDAKYNISYVPGTLTVASSTNDAYLSGLTAGAAALSPTFVYTANNYTANVPNSAASVVVTAVATDPLATLTLNGNPITTNTGYTEALSVGGNTFTVTVTAEDGVTTDTYSLTVTRAPSSNAKLSYLGLSHVVLSPSFSNTTTSYTASVPNSLTSTNVLPITVDPTATIQVNGLAVASGTSTPVALNVGANIITTFVLAQDGVTNISYSATVTRAPSSIATLSNLTLSHGGLTPGFGPAKTSYSAAVGSIVTSITETPTATDPTATITVNGVAISSGDATAPIALSTGDNTITTIVTAQDGVTTDTYTVTVTRAASSNAKLGFLGLSHAVLSPAFTTANTSYTSGVPYTLSSTNVLPIAVDATATIAVNGTAVASGASTPVSLNVGANVINAVVTAQDGTMLTYTVTVTRAVPPAAFVIYDPMSVEKPTDSPQLAEDGIVVHQGVSPNGDGIDDVLTIDGITNYPDNKLTIINRNGLLVYDTKGYDNSTRTFDGHNNKNGQMQLPGTYFYSLDYTVGGIIKHKTGYLVLKY